jgi:hypothetical protein
LSLSLSLKKQSHLSLLATTRNKSSKNQKMPDLRRAALDNDEDIRGERLTLESAQDLRVQASSAGEGIRGLAIGGNPGKGKEVPGTGAITPPQYRHVRLNWYPNSGGHQPNADTRALLKEAGGRDAMLKFTSLFYQKAFADPHLDQFIRDHGEDNLKHSKS